MQRNVQRDFEMTARVRHALAGCAGLTAVRPIACFPEELTIVTGEAVGPMLSEVLARRAVGWPRPSVVRRTSRLLYRVGAWLKAAQAALPEDHRLDREAMRTYLDKRFTDLEAHGRDPIDDIWPRRHRTLPRSALPGRQRRGPSSVWIHADFCPENIITRGGDITVLDFMMAKTGTIYHDLAHLFMHLEAMQVKPWFRPAVVARLQRDLMAGFEPGLTVRPAALRADAAPACRLSSPDPSGSRRGQSRPAVPRRLHRRHRRWLARGRRARPRKLDSVNILVDSCSYNCQNVGDLAMLTVAVSRLRELWPRAEIAVITNAPGRIARQCHDGHDRARPRSPPPARESAARPGAPVAARGVAGAVGSTRAPVFCCGSPRLVRCLARR